jgi:hypothetical protein
MAQDIGLLLRGLGASFSQQVPQFRQEMAQEQALARQQQALADQQRQRQRQTIMEDYEFKQQVEAAGYQDGLVLMNYLMDGNLEAGLNLLENRMQTMKELEQELGIKFSSDPTASIYEDVRRSITGDPEALQRAQTQTALVVAAGVDKGLIKLPEMKETIVKPGEIVLRNGEPVFTAPMGAEAPTPRTEAAKLKADFDAGLITRAQYDAGIARLEQGALPNVWQESSELRKEFSAIPAVRQFSEQANAFGRIEASASNPSAAGDLALIFNYMKVLDPGSTVREGEFANAQNAAGIPERIRAIYNNAMEGTRLTETQRSDFLSRAKNLYDNAERSYMRTYNQYKDIAQRRNLPIADALIDYRYQSSAQFPRFFNSQAEADAANLPSGSIVEIPNPEDPNEILQLRVR